MKRYVRTLAVAGAVICLCGASLQQCGGLNVWDFEEVSENGFDAADNAVDINSYAWAMDYFQADGSDTGYLYVGTGNNVAGLVVYNVQVVLGMAEADQEPIRPPEIRRYRPDLGPKVWEKVFDYRDVETDPDFGTIGFRMMTTYRAQSDGVKYLYAAAMGKVPRLWRSATGDAGSWEMVWSFSEGGSVRWMEEHNGILYFSPAKDIPFEPEVAQIWATDGQDFWTIMTDGFGNPNNKNIGCLVSYNGWLYAGTKNQITGYEIWKLLGPGEGNEAPVKVVDRGGPNPRNELAGTPSIFKGKLYMGSLLFVGGIDYETLNAFKGFDIIRIDENDDWETVVGPCSISGYDSGFNDFANAYNWWMEVHDGWLYASSYDGGGLLASIPSGIVGGAQTWLQDNLGGKMAKPDLLQLALDGRERRLRAGADLFKTCDGVHWFPVSLDGMGNRNNYGIRTMKSVGDSLYLGTANPTDGLEVWRGHTKAPN